MKFSSVLAVCPFLWCLGWIGLTVASNSSSTGVVFNPTVPYCFSFTWMGPTFDNYSNFNSTCSQHLNSRRAVGVPCSNPLVITHDATPPDINFLWLHQRNRVICRQARGEVCVKWTYYFNNAAQNVTRMCTKVWVTDEGPVTSGCYTQRVGGHEVELCVCESVAGGFKPCNGADAITTSITKLLITALLLLYYSSIQ